MISVLNVCYFYSGLGIWICSWVFPANRMFFVSERAIRSQEIANRSGLLGAIRSTSLFCKERREQIAPVAL